MDSETGKPYKNSSASSIERRLITVPVIDQFRDAVLSKNPAILTGIAPSQLIVYRNIAAFDRRNNDAANKEEKEEPLDPTQSVDGLGSQEDMLVVAVPPPPSQPSLQIQPLLFPPCKVSFFNILDNATESHGGWISFGHEVMPSTSLNSLYIRECYRTIASRILEVNGIHKAIITGTLGIGKSLFLISFYGDWSRKEGEFSSFMLHSTFSMMGMVVFSDFPALTCLLIMMIYFGMIRYGVYLTPRTKRISILCI